MYSSKKDKFNTDLLKAELAKAKELGQANIEFVNQYKDAAALNNCFSPRATFGLRNPNFCLQVDGRSRSLPIPLPQSSWDLAIGS